MIVCNNQNAKHLFGARQWRVAFQSRVDKHPGKSESRRDEAKD
jgi:hypothetical protein